MQEFEVVFYELPNGKEPAKEFLEGLDLKMQAKMLRTIALLQQNGTACGSRTPNRWTMALWS